MDVHEICADVRRSDHGFMVGIYVFLYINRPDADQAGKSDELVRKTGMAVFLVCLSNCFYIDDHISADRIEAEKSK